MGRRLFRGKRSLKGKRAIVTGASGGIGRALAVELAGRGVRQVLIARRAEQLKATAEAARSASADVESLVGDITSADVRAQALHVARDRFGGVDLLINNAGVSAYGRFATASPDRLRKIMEVNFFAAAELIREATPMLAEVGDAVVVNIGSILGCRGLPLGSEYSASKFALHGLSESIRPELAKLGVDLLLVAPGSTDTDIKKNVIEQRETPPWAAARGVPPTDVARQIASAIERRRRFIIPNGKGRLLLLANRFVPWLVDRAVWRHG
ncbi:MAG: SDR family NAD(P)-dependent oxidoreductase [Planctomycetota bacterium]